MATTTPNYGWDVPTSTDYVKDGATAIETLGDDIDASLFSITGGKNVGMVHLNTTSFTTQAAVTISNVFTSSYDNYRVVFSGSSTSNQDALFQMTVGGTAATTAYYFGQVGTLNGASVSNGGGQNVTAFNFPYISTNTTDTEASLMSPFLTRHTKIFGDWMYNLPSDVIYRRMGGYLANSTSYDGFKLSVSTGTMTGNLRIYGLRNS